MTVRSGQRKEGSAPPGQTQIEKSRVRVGRGKRRGRTAGGGEAHAEEDAATRGTSRGPSSVRADFSGELRSMYRKGAYTVKNHDR